MEMNAVTKSLGSATEIASEAPGIGLAPAAPIPTMPAIRMQKAARALSQLRRSRVRGRERKKVGIAMMPV